MNMMDSSRATPEAGQGVQQQLKHRLLLIGVLFVGFLVRFLGVFHDLPFSYFGDELHFVRRSVAFGSGDLNPHWFHKPAFYMYWLFFEYGLYFSVGYLFAWWGGVDEFARHFFTDMGPFLFIGRMTTVLFSVGTMYLTYRIGSQLVNRRVGLMAALFLAFCVGNFLSSIVVKADVPATFFAMLSLFFIIALYRTHRMRDYFLAGVFAGVGTATKYYPITMLATIFLAHVLAREESGLSWFRRLWSSKLGMSFCGWAGGFFFGAPYNFIDPTWIRQKGSFILNLHKVGTVHREAGYVNDTSVGLLEKVQSTLISLKNMGILITDGPAMGLVLGILAILGLLWMGRIAGDKGWICLSYVGVYMFVASVYSPSYASGRHISMIYPVLCIGVAMMVNRACVLIPEQRLNGAGTNLGIVSLCALLVLPGAMSIAQYDVRGLHKDTRLLAKEWIEQYIPSGAKVLLDDGGPELQMSTQGLRAMYERALQETRVGAFTTHLSIEYGYRLVTVKEPSYDILKIYRPWWLPEEGLGGVKKLETEKDLDMGNPLKLRGVMPLNYYVQQGFELAVIHSDVYKKYSTEPKKSQFPSFAQFYQDLREKGELIKAINPDPWLRRGPRVEIYRINQLKDAF